MNKRAVLQVCRTKGLKCAGSLMIGSPTETRVEMLKTAWFIFWCFRQGVTDLLLIVTSPLPGTEFWDIAVRRGKVSSNMDFSQLALHAWTPGKALLIDIPRWQFIVLFYIGQLAMFPIKAKKALRLIGPFLSSLPVRLNPHKPTLLSHPS